MTLNVAKVHYEKALNLTGWGRYNVYIFILCCCTIMATTFEIYSLNYLAPASGCELQTSRSLHETMMSLPVVALLGTSHLWGYLGDAKGRRRCLVIGTTGGFITSILAAFSPHWIVLVIFKVISSGFLGCSFPISQILMAESTPISKRNILVIGSATAFLASFGVMAALAMPILSLIFSLHIPVLNIEFNSWRLLCIIFAIPSGICALLTIPALESPKQLLAEGKEDEACQTLRRIYEINTGAPGDTYKVKALAIRESVLEIQPSNFVKAVIARTMPITKPPFSKTTYRIAGQLIVTYASLLFFVMWLVILVNAISMSASSHNELTICDMIRIYNNRTIEEMPISCSVDKTVQIAMFSISMILAAFNLVITSLVQFTGRKHLIIGIQVLSGLALFLVNASTYWILGGILIIVYLFGVLVHGIISSYIIEIFPTYLKSVALCMFLMVGSSQVKVVITIVEKFLSGYCEVVVYLYAVIACLGIVTGFLLPSDAAIQQLKEEVEDVSEEEYIDSEGSARI